MSGQKAQMLKDMIESRAAGNDPLKEMMESRAAGNDSLNAEGPKLQLVLKLREKQGDKAPDSGTTAQSAWVFRAKGDGLNRQHICRECETPCCLSELLIENKCLDGRHDELHDQDGLHGRCFQCVTGHGPWGKGYALKEFVAYTDDKVV